MEDGVAEYLVTAGWLDNRESLAQQRTDVKLSKVIRNEFGTSWAINTDMALRYTFNDDEQLSIDYDDQLATAVAVREEIKEDDLSTNILEATSAAMRSLLTAFGE